MDESSTSRAVTSSSTAHTNKLKSSTRATAFAAKLSTVIAIGLIALVMLNLFNINPIGGLRDWIFGVDQKPEAADTTLLTLRATKDLRAATGEFSVPVYFGTEQEGLVHKLPDALDGNSGIALYQGSVDAYVSLKGLEGEDLVIDRAQKTLSIRVPAPVLSDPNINEAKSKIVAQDRGLLTRIGDVFSSTPLAGKDELDTVAVEELRKAAQESNLAQTARETTTEFLTALGKRLGYETVTVEFVEPAQP